jgi:hypothetical protein
MIFVVIARQIRSGQFNFLEEIRLGQIRSIYLLFFLDFKLILIGSHVILLRSC